MKGCLIGIVIFMGLAGGAVLLVWNHRDTIQEGLEQVFELPEHGREEFIRPRYGQLLDAILTAADRSESLFQFGAAIETMALPAEVIYVGAEKGEQTTDIIRTFDWGGHSLVSSGEYGAGTLSQGNENRQVMTYSKTGAWSYMDKFMVYIAVPPQPIPDRPETTP